MVDFPHYMIRELVHATEAEVKSAGETPGARRTLSPGGGAMLRADWKLASWV